MAITVMAPIRTGAIPTSGAIIGSMGSDALLDSVSTGRGVLFGKATDHLNNAYKSFMENVVAPIRTTAMKVYNAVTSFLGSDTYVDIQDVDTLLTIPPAMRMAVMMDERFRTLLEDKRIHGYGYTPEMLPSEDFFGRMINNGVVKNVQPDEDVIFKYHFKSTDPALKDQDLDSIENTRDWIYDEYIGDSFYSDDPIALDPTDIDGFRLKISDIDIQ